MTLKLFVRQPFTQAQQAEKDVVQRVLDVLGELDGDPVPIDFLTGQRAESESTFRQTFESITGMSFSPRNFRAHRLGLIEQADAMIVIRCGLSESGAFEVAYNIFSGRRIPIFFAVWNRTPIRTTLLRELDDLCPVEYHCFDEPADLRRPMRSFLCAVRAQTREALVPPELGGPWPSLEPSENL